MTKKTPTDGNTPGTEPVPVIVEMIEELLEKAKSGEIQAFAYASSWPRHGGVSSGWEAKAGTRDDLGSAIAFLNNRYFTDAYGDEE